MYSGFEFDELTDGLLMPPDYVNPTPKARYHLVVVGAGPAGLITAIGAAGLGAKVALIERHKMGGDCLNVGCVPSKCLLEHSRAHPGDFVGAFRHVRKVRSEIAPHDSVQRYSELGVDVFLGEATFNSAGEICCDGTVLPAHRVALCTGASAAIPPIPGLADIDVLTNETVFDLDEAPSSMAILGAGAIGCELALALARLGVDVHLFEMAATVLPLEPAFAGAAVAKSLEAAGVTLHVGHGVREVSIQSGHAGQTELDASTSPVIRIVTQADSQPIEVQKVMVALGRQPNTSGLNLSAAGVEVDERGLIVTDAKLRTTNKHVYAAGDCTAKLQFTHHADAQARVVIQNALFAPTAAVSSFVVPHCTYTQPEVASVGASKAQLEADGIAFDELSVDFEELDRGRVALDGAGRATVYLKRGTDSLLGACIVGHDAGEQIAGICILMSNNLGLGALGKTLFSYPTRSEYLKRLSDAYNKTRLSPVVAKLFAMWFKLRG